jgi:hypothetical protein
MEHCMTETTRRHDWLDRAALGASFACLLHCLALPVLFSLLPALAQVMAIPESFHLWVLGFALPTSGYALVSGRVRHGARWPLALGALGLALLAIGVLWFGATPHETPVTVIGSLTLAAAHIGNWQVRHR